MIKDPDSSGQLVVFTSYARQEFASFEKDFDGQLNETIEDVEYSYPTIYFYSLDRGEIIWEIFGADAFVHLND